VEQGVQTLRAVESISQGLKVDATIRQHSAELIERFLTLRPNVRTTPRVLAASALYTSSVSCNRPLTQEEISEVAGIGTQSLRRWCKRIASDLRLSADPT
jgi:transcription initiation factor TFIIIB Brf1 subunit/transcription initiation factor TFIIB